jgi:hypothetical protein
MTARCKLILVSVLQVDCGEMNRACDHFRDGGKFVTACRGKSRRIKVWLSGRSIALKTGASFYNLCQSVSSFCRGFP